MAQPATKEGDEAETKSKNERQQRMEPFRHEERQYAAGKPCLDRW